MSKFGLMDPGDEPKRETTLTERLAAFSPVKPRSTPDLAAIDSAAAQHGFVSRELPDIQASEQPGRRRRAIPSEPTRHLAIRLSASAYNRFVAYADHHKVTYHEALIRLMDEADR
ncbi:hypothetical protein [Granulicella sibirica]|uniref:Stability/partitioning determinant n=1 Tax=Granulicella sibirica TaxID=2479048 RepID=A0A4V1L576_9BACT|nr:hypothetical protein [Granulicella sibirica]RXH54794.1 hypothetical protein GRAN_3898 [Granulicella sibirica]